MQNKRGTIPPVRCRISSASCGADSDVKWPQVTKGFVPFKICSHTIIQTFANSVDTFMSFSVICDVQFPMPSHILNEYSLLYYYICPTNVQYILTVSQSPLPAQFPSNLHTGSSTNTVSLSPSTIKLTVLYLTSLIYCNISQYTDAALSPQERQFQFLPTAHTATNHTAMFYIMWQNYKQCDIHFNVLMISIYWFFVTSTCIKFVIFNNFVTSAYIRRDCLRMK
jgi:hypothetical protein